MVLGARNKKTARERVTPGAVFRAMSQCRFPTC